MKVSANISRFDLLMMNLNALKSPSTLGWILAVYVFITYPMVFGENKTCCEIEVALLYGLKTTLILFFIFWGLITFISIVFLSSSGGILGNHTFTIFPDHFVEETDVNTTTTNWSGIKSIQKTRAAIYVRIAWHSMHIIPKSSFSSPSEFDEFYNKLIEYHKGT